MTVEEEIKAFSDHQLGQMLRGLEAEMHRLCWSEDLHTVREEEEWPHAAWNANSIIRKAIGAELKSRRPDFHLSPIFNTHIDF